ncbi:hypothetical protein HOK96_03705 [bacterium]|jgi:tetracycline resistance efflux pump|nr:hypothetical protein [bacterium]
MNSSALVLAPPLIVLFIAYLSKNIKYSLIGGIASAALLATQGSITQSISLVLRRFYAQTDLSKIGSFFGGPNPPEMLYICIFLTLVGIMIALITHTGGARAYSQIISRKLRSARSAERASILVSLAFLVDDYMSNLMTGCIMRPLTDKFKIPRAKFAYLIDSISTTLCIVVPFSDWAAYAVVQIQGSGIGAAHELPLILGSPFAVYLKTIPFMIYSIATLAVVLLIVNRSLSFGAMKKHEMLAQKTGDLFGGHPEHAEKITAPAGSSNSSLIDFIVPIATLIFTILVSVLISGKFYLFGGTNGLFQAIRSVGTEGVYFSLLVGSFFAIVAGFGWAFITNKNYTTANIYESIKEGVALMGPTVFILLLAWTFNSILRADLHTGVYLAKLASGTININLMPFIFFLISFVAAFATGSSWGVFAIMMPIAIPMLVALAGISGVPMANNIAMLFPTLGAIISGAIAGDHVSPVSETTVMASISAGCSLMSHVTTQLEYAWPVIFFSGLGFLSLAVIPHANNLLIMFACTTGITLIGSIATTLIRARKGKFLL